MIKKSLIIWMGAYMLLLSQLILATINPLNFYGLSDELINIIFAALLFIGFTILIGYKSIKIPSCLDENYSESKFLKLLLYLSGFVYFSIAVTFFYLILTLNISMQEARNIWFFGTTEIDYLKNLGIVLAVTKAVVFYHFFIWLFRTFTKRKVSISYLIPYFCYLIFGFSTGSRTIFYELVIVSLFFLQFINLRIFLNKKIFFFTIIISTLLFFITYSRIESGGIIFFLYKYFIGPLHFFGEIFKDDLVTSDGLRFLFGGFDWLFVGLLNTLGFFQEESLHSELNALLAFGDNIGPGVAFNAFPSGYFFSYYSLGNFFIFGYTINFLFLIFLKRICVDSDDKAFIIFLIFWFTIDFMRSNIFYYNWVLIFSMIVFYRSLRHALFKKIGIFIKKETILNKKKIE